MHRLFLGCNLWNGVFLVATAALGRAGSPFHVRLAVFAAVFSCLVQSGIIALFLGAAKLTKEHVGRFNMPLALIDRVNAIYHRLFPTAALGVALIAAAAIMGGLANVGRVPLWAHGLLAAGASVYLLAVIPLEYRWQSRMHGVILDVERLLPAPEMIPQAAPHPAYTPDSVVLDRRGRGKALLYIGLTLPLPYLGYTYISGRDLSSLLVPTIVLTAIFLGAAAYHLAPARRGNSRG
jgi:hypothetical protein